MSRTKIKICGLFRICDAAYVNGAMPDYAGFVFYEKSPRYVTEENARTLRTALSSDIKTVGVFVDAPMEQIERLCRQGIISIIQLHGTEDNVYMDGLRRRLPKALIWKAVQVRSGLEIAEAEKSTADMVLLDGGAGTGSVFDWSLLNSVSRDFILAGGLTPENIPLALAKVHPFAVDVSSGVETAGVKDEKKILAAVSAAKGAE